MAEFFPDNFEFYKSGLVDETYGPKVDQRRRALCEYLNDKYGFGSKEKGASKKLSAEQVRRLVSEKIGSDYSASQYSDDRTFLRKGFLFVTDPGQRAKIMDNYGKKQYPGFFKALKKELEERERATESSDLLDPKPSEESVLEPASEVDEAATKPTSIGDSTKSLQTRISDITLAMKSLLPDLDRLQQERDSYLKQLKESRASEASLEFLLGQTKESNNLLALTIQGMEGKARTSAEARELEDLLAISEGDVRNLQFVINLFKDPRFVSEYLTKLITGELDLSTFPTCFFPEEAEEKTVENEVPSVIADPEFREKGKTVPSVSPVQPVIPDQEDTGEVKPTVPLFEELGLPEKDQYGRLMDYSCKTFLDGFNKLSKNNKDCVRRSIELLASHGPKYMRLKTSPVRTEKGASFSRANRSLRIKWRRNNGNEFLAIGTHSDFGLKEK